MKVIQTSGKRKCAIARATLRPGTGIVRVNHTPIDKIQPYLAKMKIQELMAIVDDEKLKTINIDVIVEGGGTLGQIEAARISISRAIVKFLAKKRILKEIRAYDRSLIS